jgi:hypothetical protein
VVSDVAQGFAICATLLIVAVLLSAAFPHSAVVLVVSIVLCVFAFVAAVYGMERG